jgi:outer membrane protein TolC
MKTIFNKKLMLIILTLGFCVVGYSQQSDSLNYYLETAVKNNPTVLQRYNEFQAALQKVPQVGSLPDPQLQLGVFLSPMELIEGKQVAQINLMQMFPWFGVLKNAKDEMSLMAKAKYESFRDAKLQVYYDVQRTWFDLYKVRQNISISKKNLDLLNTIERLTVVKYKYGSIGGGSSSTGSNITSGSNQTATSGSSGMNTMGGNSGASNSPSFDSSSAAPMGLSSGSTGLSDVYQIHIEKENSENSIALLKNEEQIVVATFNSLLNRKQTIPVSISDSLLTEQLDISYLSVSDSMFTRNPMLGMLHYEKKSLISRKKMQNQMGFPMVGLGINYSVINKSEMSTSPMNGNDMIMPMVTLTLPIYRDKYKAMQAETNYLKIASEQNYQATSNALQTDYYEALQLYFDAQRRVKLYEGQRKLAKKTLNIMIKTFSSANSSMTDILRVSQQLLDYEFKQVEALTDFNKAKAWVKRLANNS